MGLLAITPFHSLLGRLWPSGIALQPADDFIVIELLAPQQADEGLPLDQPGILREAAGRQGVIELIGLPPALSEDGFKGLLCQQVVRRRIGKTEAKGGGSARLHVH